MFDSEASNYDSNQHGSNHEENDMDLSSIDAANFDAMVAEEAILDWLVNLESEDTGYELAETDEQVQEPRRLAN